ncbi:MAG TPA: DUF4124 domain-containing protein [Burkholderiaceae bacterium]|nr:DUF4124 domain-containing protein [Burkholderiaceae bacterium]
MRFPFACMVLGALALSGAVSAAELYKWVDESGAVTYGDAPPPNAKSLRVLGKDAGSVSVVPGLSPEQLDRMRNAERDLRMRRLELEVEELRLREQRLAQMQQQAAYADPAQAVAWDGYWGWGGGYPVAGQAWRDKRFWPRPAPRSRPDLDLLPYVTARQITTPPAAEPRGSRR